MPSSADTPSSNRSGFRNRLDRLTLHRWWRRTVVEQIDHETVVTRIFAESGWSARYAFMTMMSAGIAVLGLLLSSPAVVIGAMLISPLMGPILGFGFSLALFDFSEMRRAAVALLIGSFLAVVFTAAIVALSPLQAQTAEIVSRTRPNLFDLGVALFAALAGSLAIIRGRGETIVGVAIATALMPPLAVTGYGLPTWNLPVLGGSFALFLTNFITIALAAAAMARFYGFGHYLSSQQSWTQTIILLLVFSIMAVPLGLSLIHIAREALTVSQVRSVLNERFGSDARVTQLEIKFDREPIAIRSVVITPRGQVQQTAPLKQAIEAVLGRPVRLDVDQLLLGAGADALDAQREELRRAGDQSDPVARQSTELAHVIALIAGVSADDVTIDRDHRRATARAVMLPGAAIATYRTLEARAAAETDGWNVAIVPPQMALPEIAFADDADELDVAGRAAVMTSAWAASRWNVPALTVPGLPAGELPSKPSLAQRRAKAIAAILATQGIGATGGAPAGSRLALSIATPR
ncbi:TIGR00341 family protein [Sphingomonas antarctica]